MTLYADLHVTRGTFHLDLELTVEPGEVVALLGPNGAGKSTAIRAIAGLLPVTSGEIRLGDDLWDAPPRVFRSADQRPIGVVFQDYLLFNHLSALENVAFGLRARGTPKQTARAEAARWLETVGLSEYARTRPRSLSGGQAQRVALVRALATSPDLLLLDEPWPHSTPVQPCTSARNSASASAGTTAAHCSSPMTPSTRWCSRIAW